MFRPNPSACRRRPPLRPRRSHRRRQHRRRTGAGRTSAVQARPPPRSFEPAPGGTPSPISLPWGHILLVFEELVGALGDARARLVHLLLLLGRGRSDLPIL